MSVTPFVEDALKVDLTGLQALAAHIPEMSGALNAAAEVVLSVEGRLIVTGLGKSGHVGAKLAATFASTGTPAHFMHPSEASHGDLGMVQANDAILALSWSGETKELSDILGFCKRRSVPLIAITGNKNSSLASAATVALVLPSVREACPHNLAPTTSTLLQMAIGDALAIALLQMRGFTEESFHGFHPGGSLGAALKRVDEIMHLPEVLPLVGPDASVFDAIAELSAKGHGIVGVADENALLGVVTDGDIRRYLERNATSTMQAALHEAKAATVMTKDALSLGPQMLVGEAMATLQSRRIAAAFVLDGEKPVGLITMLRLLNRGAA